MIVRKIEDTLLDLSSSGGEPPSQNHIFEPEFHQQQFVDACNSAKATKGSFQLGDPSLTLRAIKRGKQPSYADDDGDPESLEFEGMMLPDGSRMNDHGGQRNVCALKSNCVRRGFIDFGLARSASRDFFIRNKSASVEENDLLINSTGDGTIGRVAVYNKSYPALVDGHISIVRFKDPDLAWYSAAFLLSEIGQAQIYRYINGSSGQVEIYPQDLARIWVSGGSDELVAEVANTLRNACLKHDEFYTDMTRALRAF